MDSGYAIWQKWKGNMAMIKKPEFWAESYDFSLLKRTKGYEKDKNSYHGKKIPVVRFVSMEFDASDLYNFQNASDFIFDDEEDKRIFKKYENLPNADYLFIYHYGASDMIIIPFSETEMMDFAGFKKKVITGNDGLFIYKRLCDSVQNYHINTIEKVISRKLSKTRENTHSILYMD